MAFPLEAKVRAEESLPNPERAISNHDPARYEGRLWNELSISEQEAVILAASSREYVERVPSREKAEVSL